MSLSQWGTLQKPLVTSNKKKQPPTKRTQTCQSSPIPAPHLFLWNVPNIVRPVRQRSPEVARIGHHLPTSQRPMLPHSCRIDTVPSYRLRTPPSNTFEGRGPTNTLCVPFRQIMTNLRRSFTSPWSERDSPHKLSVYLLQAPQLLFAASLFLHVEELLAFPTSVSKNVPFRAFRCGGAPSAPRMERPQVEWQSFHLAW